MMETNMDQSRDICTDDVYETHPQKSTMIIITIPAAGTAISALGDNTLNKRYS